MASDSDASAGAGSVAVDADTAAVRAAIRDGIAVGVATAAYGISFGALAVAAGFDIWQTCVLSLLMFTGGSQFALVGVIAAGGVAAGPSAILSAGHLGARNSLFPALGVAAVLFALRVPFVLVVLAAALVAAGIRALT